MQPQDGAYRDGDQQEIPTGQTLAGRYRVESALGRGGMARVYRVWDERRAAPLAIKVLDRDFADDYGLVRHFRREAETLRRLEHPHIVRFYGLEQDGPRFFLVMDYVEGTTLRRRIGAGRETPLSAPQVVALLTPVCSALAYAHSEDIVHADVKPENILIDRNGRVVLSDFGIAATLDQSTVTGGATRSSGTPAYMAPEQWVGNAVLTPRTDIYALGVLTYELLTLRRPFDGNRAPVGGDRTERVGWEHRHLAPIAPRVLDPSIPGGVEAVILRALAKDPDGRPPSVLAFLDDLRRGAGRAEEIPGIETVDPTVIVASPPDAPPPAMAYQPYPSYAPYGNPASAPPAAQPAYQPYVAYPPPAPPGAGYPAASGQFPALSPLHGRGRRVNPALVFALSFIGVLALGAVIALVAAARSGGATQTATPSGTAVASPRASLTGPATAVAGPGGRPPTPAPLTRGGDIGKEVAAGESGLSIRVDEVRFQSEGGALGETQWYVLIHATVTNTTGSNANSSSILEYRVRDAKNKTYAETITGLRDVSAVTNGKLLDGTIPPGGSISGWVFFPVDIDATGLVLDYSPGGGLGIVPRGTALVALGR